MPRFIHLPETGLTIDAEQVAFIARKGINEYALFLRGLANGLVITGVDLDAFHSVTETAKPEAPSKVLVQKERPRSSDPIDADERASQVLVAS